MQVTLSHYGKMRKTEGEGSMKEKKGIIFDMDGTVWDSSENVAKAWTVKIKEAGFDKIGRAHV